MNTKEMTSYTTLPVALAQIETSCMDVNTKIDLYNDKLINGRSVFIKQYFVST